jgi:glycosyltransferase involved in cell wall biosynthesis
LALPQQRLTASVVIVTRNRPALLARALESLTRQTLAPDEVVVVDNNSTVSYSQVFERFAPRLPLKTVIEPKTGIPFARNRGLQEASGDIILFTDDDCEPEPQWVEELVRPFYRDPHIGAVGGPLINAGDPNSLIQRFYAAERE